MADIRFDAPEFADGAVRFDAASAFDTTPRTATLTLVDDKGGNPRTNHTVDYRLRDTIAGAVVDSGQASTDASGDITFTWTGGTFVGQQCYFELWDTASGYYASGVVAVGTGTNLTVRFDDPVSSSYTVFDAPDAIAPDVLGEGALQAGAASASGQGIVSVLITGSGVMQIDDAGSMEATGGSAETITGSGALQAGDSQMAGEGAAQSFITGTGQLQAGDSQVAGVGEHTGIRSGVGALAAAAAMVNGLGGVRKTVTGAGALQSEPARVDGIGDHQHNRSGTGALLMRPATLAGVGAVQVDLTDTPVTFEADVVWSHSQGFTVPWAAGFQAREVAWAPVHEFEVVWG